MAALSVLEQLEFVFFRVVACKSIELFDVYEGEKIPNDKKSYGIRFTFLDNRKTLTDNYVDKIMNKLKIQFENKFNAQLRK